MRPPLLVALAVLAALVVAGCGPDRDRDRLDAKVLYPTERGDQGFVDGVHAGVSFGRFVLDVTLEEVVETDPARVRELLDLWLDTAPGPPPRLAVLAGGGYASLVDERGCALGSSDVLLVAGEAAPCPGLRSALYRVFAPSFQAGVVAVEVAPDGRAGVLIGGPLDGLAEFADGFAAGVDFAGGELLGVRSLGADASGFEDPERARVAAERFFADGAEVIFALANRANSGIVEAALARPEGEAFVIGADSDQTTLGASVVLSSVLRRTDRTVRAAMTESARGGLEPGTVVGDLRNGATENLLNPLFEARAGDANAAAAGPALAAEAAYFGDEGDASVAPTFRRGPSRMHP